MTIPNLREFLLKRPSAASRLDPERDWLVLLIIGGVLLSGIVVWNVWAFNIVSGGGSIGNVVTKTEPAFNQASLDTLHTFFETRAAEEEKYKTGTYEYTDPSL